MSTTVKPIKPWAATPRDRFITGLSVGLSLLTSVVVVLATPMKGKLAYFAVFFLAWFVIDSLFILRKSGSKGVRDGLAAKLTFFGGVLVCMAVFSILWATISRGLKGINLAFLTENMRNASLFDPIGKGGILHAISGTLMLIAIAIIISVPMGILTALYLTEIKGKAAGLIQFLVQAMSGVPSVVAGLFIFSAILLPITKANSSLLGSMALAILMVPTVARTAEEVLNLIPNDLREAGVALGATQWRTVSGVVVPAAKSGLVTAVILGIARIIGETAPILLVSGGADALNFNPTSGPMGSLPFYIWKAFLTGGTEEAYARAWGGMLILLILIMVLFGLARYLSGRKAS